MSIKTIVGLVIVVLTGCMDVALTCTALCLHNEQNLFVGKNLDWPVADGVVLVNPRNITNKALLVEDVQLKSQIPCRPSYQPGVYLTSDHMFDLYRT